MSLPYAKVWTCDFEFVARPGELVNPVCLVARELTSNTVVRLWADELRGRRRPPYGTGPDTLFVAYNAAAEIGCHLVLGWPLPTRILDLYCEFRTVTNGRVVPCGNGLIGALEFFGLPSIGADEKKSMIELVLSGGPWSDSDRLAILDYCQSDVDALSRLLSVMTPHIDLPRALLRGRYMAAVARIEQEGVPIDTHTLTALCEQWDEIKLALIADIDAEYHVHEGATFKRKQFAAYLVRHEIPWPRLPSGDLDLDKSTFKIMAEAYPQLEPLRQLRKSVAQMSLRSFAVGSDGRNRAGLRPFASKSGRNQPKSSESIFGAAAWMRSLVQPQPGQAIAYLDWAQQEFGVAAALSGDEHMVAAYESGDPYLAFAVQARAAPPEATKDSHRAVRELYKACVLGTQYGMGAESMALRIQQEPLFARALLDAHRRTYPRFWSWSDAASNQFALKNYVHTCYGWRLHTGTRDNDRSVRNFPMQAHGAEMMRVAACLLTEAGVRVCLPVHDAFLIEAPEPEIDEAVLLAQQLMSDASARVLAGFRLRTAATIYRHPDRYADARGVAMWSTVTQRLDLGRTRVPCAQSAT